MSFFPSVAFLTDSAGAGEWIVLFVVILIVVGPKKLPEVVRKIGRTMEMFRRAADEFKEQLMSMDQEPTQPQPYSYTPPATTATELPPPAAGAAAQSESPASAAPASAYPDVANYPGNEGQVNQGASAAPAGTSPAAGHPLPSPSPEAATDKTAKEKA